MPKIDPIDKKISDLLILDGRMSCSEIAKRIGGITERAVRYRIDRMVKEGIISIRGNVNARGLGMPVFADVFIEVEPALVQEVALKIAEYELVSYVACSTGETDISIQVFARDNGDLYRFVTETIGRIPGVRKTHTSLVPLVIKDDHLWHIPEVLVKDAADKQKS